MPSNSKELVIQISGDISDYKAALKLAKEDTEGLSDAMESVAKYSAIAFAAITGEILFATHAFNQERQAISEVSSALQAQGIYTAALAARYREIAETIEKKTGVESEAIASGQAVLQSQIGQVKITKELTQGIVDFAARTKVDVVSAFKLVGQEIATGQSRLSAYNVNVEEGLSKQERLARVTELLGAKFHGAAEAAAASDGGFKLLIISFENLQKKIGEKFEPAITAATKAITSFISFIGEHEELVNFGVAALAAGAAVAGLLTVLGTAGAAFLALKAALLAAGIATGAMSLAVGTLVGATGIGLLIIIATEIYIHWNSIFPRLKAIFQGFVTFVVEYAKGLYNILTGLITFSPEKIKEGINGYIFAIKKGFDEATKKLEPVELPAPKGGQDKGQKDIADREAAIADEKERIKLDKIRASNELVRLETDRASKDLIDLKKQEVDILGKLEDDKNIKVRAALKKQLDEVRQQQEEAKELGLSQRQELEDDLLKHNEDFQKLTEEQKQSFLIRNRQQLEAQVLTEKNIRQKAAAEELQIQIKAHNQFLLEQQKFGTAYALINTAMHSAVYQGTKTAFGELAALTQSSNSTLKTIGKIAAVANIIIRTAESAMNIYAGFSQIPIIGPALGVAGAAAAVAFGAEQIGRVQGAAQGGLITGGIPGIDSVPVLAQQGELVAPVQNFDEVIGSVRAAREAERFVGGGGGDDDSSAAILEQLQQINSKFSQPSQYITTVQGDVMADNSFIDALAKRIGERILYANLKIQGLNA